MKFRQLILFIFFTYNAGGQAIFKYEQKINRTDNLALEELSFFNAEDNLQLAGTLIYPKEGFEKLIIIIPGSGKDTRHSHYRLAEYFLEQGIAVCRFDDRGIGKSTGKFDDMASSLTSDVVCIFQGLKEKKGMSNKKIGVLGHSLGGIASIGAYAEACYFDFLIQMATPVENKGAFLKYQATSMEGGWSKVKHKTSAEVLNFLDELANIISLEDDFKTTKQKAKPIIKQMDFKKGRHIVNPVIVDLMKQAHEKTYKNCSVPVLYIIGSEDLHVSSQHELMVLERLNNHNIETKLIQNVDHYLTEKQDPRYEINPKAVEEIIKWTWEL